MRFKRGLSIYITSITLLSLNLYAINRDILIGVGAKSRGMGGMGIAFNNGSKSTFVINSALITKVKDTQISFGGTIFNVEIKTDIRLTNKIKKVVLISVSFQRSQLSIE
jgi:long-chain fatty acid transport protein